MGHIENAKNTFELEIQALETLKNSINAEFEKACDIILKNNLGRVIITGMGKSGHIGKKIAESQNISIIIQIIIHI